MKIVILSGGTPPSYDLLTKEISNGDFLICADSGANCLIDYDIYPDFLIGDFDSISKEVMDLFCGKNIKIERYPKEKDWTDTEIAFQKACSLGADEIIFLGCTGGRIDHTLGNLGLLKKCLDLNIKAYIIDDKNILFMAGESLKLKGKPGECFSLQAFGSSVSNLSLKNVKYTLTNYKLDFGDPRTISNEFIGGDAEISFDYGNLLIIFSKD